MNTRFSPRGGAVRGLVVSLGVALTGYVIYLIYLAQLPPSLRERAMASAVPVIGEALGKGFGISVGMGMAFGVLALAVLTIFIPWFLFRTAQETRRTREVLERMEDLLRMQNYYYAAAEAAQQEAHGAMQTDATEAEELLAATPPPVPTPGPRMPDRVSMRRLMAVGSRNRRPEALSLLARTRRW